MRWLVRFGYDGVGRWGWARQPGRPTVEGDIRAGLVGIGARVLDPDVEVASRTDRGVSARGNALALTSRLGGVPLLRALNGIAADVWFTAATPIPEAFVVRRARRRVYRYFEHGRGAPDRRIEEAVRLLEGRIDVRSFGRDLSRSSPVWREVEAVTVTSAGAGWVVEVRAPSFVWGMVRKIVAALRAVDEGRLTPALLGRVVGGEKRLSLPMAEPEPLVLWDVEYDLPWEVRWRGPNRHQREHLRAGVAASLARMDLFEAVGESEVRRPM
jgi:tRNA pseudouridine38-40 synthase